jgi:hypothetical protein
MGEMGLIPDWAVSGLVASCLPSGHVVEAYPYGKPKESTTPIVYTTDGMNNVAKLKRMKLRAQLHDMNANGVLPAAHMHMLSSSSSSSTNTDNISAAVKTVVEAPVTSRNSEVFFFCASQDEMMPQEFSRELLIARYGYGIDGDMNEFESEEEEGDDDDDDDDERFRDGTMVRSGSGKGFFSWFRRSRGSQEDHQEGFDRNRLGNVSSVSVPPQSSSGEIVSANDADNGASNVLGVQPSPLLMSHELPTQDLVESVSLDSVLSTLTSILLCGDGDSSSGRSRYSHGDSMGRPSSSSSSAAAAAGVSRKERKELRKLRREANAMHLEAMRAERFAILEGPHGTYFGGQRRAVAMYEAFLRKCNLLPHHP